MGRPIGAWPLSGEPMTNPAGAAGAGAADPPAPARRGGPRVRRAGLPLGPRSTTSCGPPARPTAPSTCTSPTRTTFCTRWRSTAGPSSPASPPSWGRSPPMPTASPRCGGSCRNSPTSRAGTGPVIRVWSEGTTDDVELREIGASCYAAIVERLVGPHRGRRRGGRPARPRPRGERRGPVRRWSSASPTSSSRGASSRTPTRPTGWAPWRAWCTGASSRVPACERRAAPPIGDPAAAEIAQGSPTGPAILAILETHGEDGGPAGGPPADHGANAPVVRRVRRPTATPGRPDSTIRSIDREVRRAERQHGAPALRPPPGGVSAASRPSRALDRHGGGGPGGRRSRRPSTGWAASARGGTPASATGCSSRSG